MGNFFNVIILLVSGFLIGNFFAYRRFRKVRTGNRQTEQEVVLQGELIKTTARLSKIQNQYDDLEKRCSSLVHDLKSPLVTITGFSDLLENDLQEGNMEQVAHNLERINSGVDALKELLDNLQQNSMNSTQSDET